MYDTDKSADRFNASQAGAFLLGIVCGAVAGAAAGLLFAPKSGAALRRQIADSTERVKRHAVQTYGDAVAAFRDATASGAPLE